MAAVLERATKMPLEDYARMKLFEPLGITDVEWMGDLAGMPAAASGLRLRPRDLAKFGSLYLHGGKWNGKQVIPADWVDTSTRRQFPLSAANRSRCRRTLRVTGTSGGTTAIPTRAAWSKRAPRSATDSSGSSCFRARYGRDDLRRPLQRFRLWLDPWRTYPPRARDRGGGIGDPVRLSGRMSSVLSDPRRHIGKDLVVFVQRAVPKANIGNVLLLLRIPVL